MLPSTSLRVEIPAYNEAAHIAACLSAVQSREIPCSRWQVLVVDDNSSDATADLALRTAAEHGQSATDVQLVQAGPRPQGERWVGKNWACTRAMEQVSSSWVLFIDADVLLKPDALRRALAQAIDEEADLFSLAPRLVCGCLAEWMVQPIMASLLGLGFPIVAANDPSSPVAFAAGPFMLFRRAARMTRSAATAPWLTKWWKTWLWHAGSNRRDTGCVTCSASTPWTCGCMPTCPRSGRSWTRNWFLGLDRDPLKSLGARPWWC